MERIVHLVRAGQRGERDDGSAESGLTETGRVQAQAAAARLATESSGAASTSVRHSEAACARATAEIIASALGSQPIADHRLLDIKFLYDPDGVPDWDACRPDEDPAHGLAWDAYELVRQPGGDAPSTTVVVGPAELIRYFVCRAVHPSRDEFIRMYVSNGSITTLSVGDDGAIRLVEFASDKHVAEDQRSFA